MLQTTSNFENIECTIINVVKMNLFTILNSTYHDFIIHVSCGNNSLVHFISKIDRTFFTKYSAY